MYFYNYFLFYDKKFSFCSMWRFHSHFVWWIWVLSLYAHELHSDVTNMVFLIFLSSVYLGSGESVHFLMWEQVGNKSHYTWWQDNVDSSMWVLNHGQGLVFPTFTKFYHCQRWGKRKVYKTVCTESSWSQSSGRQHLRPASCAQLIQTWYTGSRQYS
jgi:hypothetical protein